MSTSSIPEALELGLLHHRAGRLAEAEGVYRRILADEPGHPDALHLLGVIAHQVGQNETALRLIGEAILRNPEAADYHHNLGLILEIEGNHQEAEAAYRTALRFQPDYAEAHHSLGKLLMDQARWLDAVACYRRCLELAPNHFKAYSNLGTALNHLGQNEAAVAAFRAAIGINPKFAEIHSNLGIALKALGQRDDAIKAYRAAIALNPNLPETHNNLGNTLEDVGRIEEAISEYRTAIHLRPNYAAAYSNLANTLADQGELDDAIACYRQAIAADPDDPTPHSNLLFLLHFQPGCEASFIREEHRIWNQQHADRISERIRPHGNDRNANRRLKIGYVSPDFQNHAVGRFVLPLLEAHNPAAFEIFCYSDVITPDSMTHRLQGLAHTWRNTVGLSHGDVANLVREDGIDILVDLAAHSARNRLLVFAEKPAPIQVTYLAYPSTTGLDTIDYRLTDPYLDPQHRHNQLYSEESFRLPNSYWCYRPPVGVPDVKSLPARETGLITFGCLNSFWKVNALVLKTWCAILRRVPQSTLLVHAYQGRHRERAQSFLMNEGLDPNRLAFVERLPLTEYFQAYHRIDIALDPFPFGGGTTTCDALWMGVPVVSLAGDTAVSRGGLSILSNIGLPELVAQSEQEYRQIAANLTLDLSRLAELRMTLRERMQASPLMNETESTRAIESAYRVMWRRWSEEGVNPLDADA